MVEGYPGLPAYCWNKRLAPLLATFLGDWALDHGLEGVYLDGYVEADRIGKFSAPSCPPGSVVVSAAAVGLGCDCCSDRDRGCEQAGHYTVLSQKDTLDSVPNLGITGGKCGYGHKPCNISALKAECDATNGCAGFNSNGWLKQGPLNSSSLHRTPSAVADNSSFFLRSSTTLTCEYDYDGDGEADTPTEHAGMYWAWRSAFVAALRQRLGEKALIFANSAGAVSDPSLSGVTIEMESCTGGEAGVQHCSDALEGQRAATLAAGREALSVLWMTHSESMSAAQQVRRIGRSPASLVTGLART